MSAFDMSTNNKCIFPLFFIFMNEMNVSRPITKFHVKNNNEVNVTIEFIFLDR